MNNNIAPDEKLDINIHDISDISGQVAIGKNIIQIQANAKASGGEETQIPIEKNVYVKIHHNFNKERNTIEIHPLQGKWYPFFVGILHREITAVDPQIEYAPAGSIPRMSCTALSKNPPSENTDWQFFIGHKPATPENSYFISCNKLPSSISFGETDPSKAKYKYEFGDSSLLCDD